MHCMYISHATKPERSTREHNETEDNNKRIIEERAKEREESIHNYSKLTTERLGKN